MNLRIKRYPDGWVVEIQKGALIFKYWTHFISAVGLSETPWYFGSEEWALKEMLQKIKWQTIKNSRD